MTKTEIKIKLKSLIKSGDFELVEQLLEGLDDMDYFKYSIHCVNTNVDKEFSADWRRGHIEAINLLEKFKTKLQTKYNNMCAEAIETTESTGRE